MNDFSILLIEWYQQNKRDLPWRNTTNPYKIWLSEIILQQTRVQQGLPYYQKFVENYPKVENLAQAKESEVLRLWQGLGYYSRARNMLVTAKTILENYKGIFPNNYNEILKLKGIGKYTAAAIASFAFNEKVAVVDGNVYRVLSRVFGIDSDITSGKGQKDFLLLAEKLLPENLVATYNQAIMEFGALHCKPSNPDCENCIFSYKCDAKSTNKQAVLPYKSKKIKVKKRFFFYLVIEYDNNLLLKERIEKDIWQGLFDFFLIEKSSELSDEELLVNVKDTINFTNDYLIHKISNVYVHKLTHQHLFAKFIHIKMKNLLDFKMSIEKLSLSTNSIREVHELPKPILVNNYLKEFIF